MRIVFLLILFALSPYANSNYGDALKTLNQSTGDGFLNDMGISGSGVGNIGKGKGGARITQTRTDTIPCNSEEYSYKSINSVSFSCVKNPSGYGISYCDKGVYGSTCLTGSDYKLISGTSVTDRDVSITRNSCSDEGCTLTVKLSRTQQLDGDDLDNVGQSSLQGQYGDDNSVVSMTMGAGVYDQEGNVVVAGKNENAGKLHGTLLTKQDTIDCAQRQANELSDDGKTGTCAQPEIPIRVFDRDGNLDCEDVKQCLDSVIHEKIERKSCFVSVPLDAIMQNDKTRHEACTTREQYNCTQSNEWKPGCNSGDGELIDGKCRKKSCKAGTRLLLVVHNGCPYCLDPWIHHELYCESNDRVRANVYSSAAKNGSVYHSFVNEVFQASPLDTFSWRSRNLGNGCTFIYNYSQSCDWSTCSGRWQLTSTCNGQPYTRTDSFPVPVISTDPTLIEVAGSRSCSQ